MAATEAERTRLAAVAAIEAACVVAWPALRTERDGSWLWRFARGYTKRANCIQCHDPTDDADAEARILRLAALSREAGIAPVFRVTPLAGPGIAAALGRLGWPAFEHSRILGADTLAACYDVAHRVEVVAPVSDAWLDAQARLQGLDPARRETLALMAARMPESAGGILVRDAEGVAVASALSVTVEGIAIFLNVVTDPGRRRQGLGRSAMGAALNHALDAGARQAGIQVLAGNGPALSLYRSLGFVEHGTYHYCKGE